MTAVRLWTLDLAGVGTPPPSWLAMLDDAELNQWRRFRRPSDGLAYAAAHALLRLVLSRAIRPHAIRPHAIRPRAIQLCRDERGKPRLADTGNPGLEFNLSHTDGLVAVALSEVGAVGVDVESIDRVGADTGFSDLVELVLQPSEAVWFASLPERERPGAFLKLWTAREAVAKADGRGLSLALPEIALDFAGGTATVRAAHEAALAHWRLYQFQPTPRHLLAIAWPLGVGDIIQMPDVPL